VARRPAGGCPGQGTDGIASRGDLNLFGYPATAPAIPAHRFAAAPKGSSKDALWELVAATDLLVGLRRRAVDGAAAQRSYALALALSAVALALSLLLLPFDADDSVASVLFLAAVGLSGWYAGLPAALLATVCGAVAIDYFFETPPTPRGNPAARRARSGGGRGSRSR
jgi:hypothetical protein